jgi:hypothetical protein
VGLNAPPEDAGAPLDADAGSTLDSSPTPESDTATGDGAGNSELVGSAPDSGGCTTHPASEGPYSVLLLGALLGLFVGRKKHVRLNG